MKILNIVVFCSLALSSLLSQDISQMRIVGEPKEEPSELVAKEIRDANGKTCAGLIIYSDLKGLSFQSNNGIVKRTPMSGKDFLFLSPDERVVEVFCDGYAPLKIVLNDVGIRLKSSASWSLKITGDKKSDVIAVNIVVKPEGATITIDGVNKGTGVTHPVTPGKHTLQIEKQGYKTITPTIDVSPSNILFNYTLQEVELQAVNIISNPKGAKILINNGEQGETDKGVFLYAGTYSLQLIKSGYLDIKTTIEVRENVSNKFTYNLTRNVGVLQISVTPSDARVLINGSDYTGKREIEFIPGKYSIQIDKSQYLPISDNIEVELGKTLSKNYILLKNSAILRLDVTPTDAAVLLNKQDYTGKSEIELVPGKYKIEISKQGYYSAGETVELQLGATVKKQFTLTMITGALQFSVTPLEAKAILNRGGSVVQQWEGLKIVKPLQAGEYDLEVSANGYQTAKKKIQIEENRTVVEDITLKKAEVAPTPVTTGTGMVYIPAGWFDMGSENGYSNEKPVHKVFIDAFYMDKYEVTVGEFKRFIDATGYSTDADKGDGSWIWEGKQWTQRQGINWRHNEKGELRKSNEMNYPVIHVSWNDAVAYARWAGKRLPTEAEWEYAARGGAQGFKYSWGNGDPSGQRGGNIGDESAKRVFSDWPIWNNYDDGYVYGAPVGSFSPNVFGLYDMTGNVWEWCQDWYDSEYYKKSPERNPKGPENGTYRVLRGGSWGYYPGGLRAANRFRFDPAYRSDGLGFRCVQEVK